MKKYLYILAAVMLIASLAWAGNVFYSDQITFKAGAFPEITVTNGEATGNDSGVVFDGNAEDFYIGIDDSADDLIIGLGSTMGTTPKVTISDYGSDKATVKLTGQIADIYLIDGTTITGGAKTLTADDCGRTIVDKDETPATTWTLPANAVAGCKFKFIVGIDQTAADTVTAATADTIYCMINVNNTLYEGAATPSDVVNFVNTADSIGDWVECTSDGTNWFCTGVGADAGSITCTG